MGVRVTFRYRGAARRRYVELVERLPGGHFLGRDIAELAANRPPFRRFDGAHVTELREVRTVACAGISEGWPWAAAPRRQEH
jgi:hypothetical protein